MQAPAQRATAVGAVEVSHRVLTPAIAASYTSMPWHRRAGRLFHPLGAGPLGAPFSGGSRRRQSPSAPSELARLVRNAGQQGGAQSPPIVGQPASGGARWNGGPGATRIAKALIVGQPQGGGGEQQWAEWLRSRPDRRSTHSVPLPDGGGGEQQWGETAWSRPDRQTAHCVPPIGGVAWHTMGGMGGGGGGVPGP